MSTRRTNHRSHTIETAQEEEPKKTPCGSHRTTLLSIFASTLRTSLLTRSILSAKRLKPSSGIKPSSLEFSLTQPCLGHQNFLLLPQPFNRSPKSQELKLTLFNRSPCKQFQKHNINAIPNAQPMMWKAEGLLVKPGFDEAGRCPGRCPIHEDTIQIYHGRRPTGETRLR